MSIKTVVDDLNDAVALWWRSFCTFVFPLNLFNFQIIESYWLFIWLTFRIIYWLSLGITSLTTFLVHII